MGTTEDPDYDPFADTRKDRSIASRQNDYQKKRLTARQISPERIDPFAGEFCNYFKHFLIRRYNVGKNSGLSKIAAT